MCYFQGCESSGEAFRNGCNFVVQLANNLTEEYAAVEYDCTAYANNEVIHSEIVFDRRQFGKRALWWDGDITMSMLLNQH